MIVERLPHLPAFRAGEVPVATKCQACGGEILFGAAASRIEVEIGLCLACPSGSAERAALFGGVLAGIETAKAEDEHLGIWSNPHPFASHEYHLWKRGWWAGLGACEEDDQLFRKRLDIGLARA